MRERLELGNINMQSFQLVHGRAQTALSPHDLNPVALREDSLFLRPPCIPHLQMLLGGVLNHSKAQLHPAANRPGLRKSWLKQTVYSVVDVDTVV